MIVRSILMFLFLVPSWMCAGQGNVSHPLHGSIRVKVIDAETNQPIPYANVYLNQTTIGGYTDARGEIEISRIPFGTYELVFSEISHKPLQRKLVINNERPLYLTVNLLVTLLKEVVVNANHDEKWHRQLARFERLFLGPEHLKYCKITNPWVLEFKTVRGDFTAVAEQPLTIENEYLGYNINFQINSCVFGASLYTISGNARFEEKQGSDSLINKWKENRENIYRGSPQHFFKAVVDSSLAKVGYEIYADITADADIVRGANFLENLKRNLSPTSTEGRVKATGNGMYTIRFPSRLEVHYLRRRAKATVYRNVAHPVGWMEVKGETLTVNRYGIVQNPDNLVLLGNMSGLKVGEWLPLDYQYTEPDDIVPIVKPADLQYELLEKPYIQTDRNYYYNGETMWLAGYMNYSVPLLKDTLSQSIYVELINHAGKTVITKRYPVEEGKFHGDMLLDPTLKTGLYQLKAYTAWMLNFDERLIFTKTIDLLGEKEAVRVAQVYKRPADTLKSIVIRTDKMTYEPREKIVVSIDVTDTLDFATVSDLSISVTDLEQAVPPLNERSILTDFKFEDLPVSDSSAQVRYNIEYGIDFSGTFWLGKKKNAKPTQASITIFQDNTKETFGIITDEAGRFERSLSFKDTLNFYLNALSANSKKGVVVMDTLRPRSPQLSFDPLSLDVYSADANRHIRSVNLNAATLLKEVTITSKKIEKAPSPAVIHGKGDYRITGDWINEHNFTDILLAIAAKTPGIVYDPNGPTLYFRTAMGSFSGPVPPLILVDGTPISGLGQLGDVPIRSLDFVDVLKFSATSIYGARGAGGVIAVYTKKGIANDPGDRSFDKSKLQTVKWSGYSSESTFTSPDYSQPSDNDYFDYRATIYWSPGVITNGKEPATVSFYAADAITKYRVVVEGVTAGGVPLHAEKIIQVVK